MKGKKNKKPKEIKMKGKFKFGKFDDEDGLETWSIVLE